MHKDVNFSQLYIYAVNGYIVDRNCSNKFNHQSADRKNSRVMSERRSHYERTKKLLVDDIKDANKYSEMVWKHGLADFSPAIVTCAITGGNNGKESIPIFLKP